MINNLSRANAIEQQIIQEQYNLDQMNLKMDSRIAEHDRRVENHKHNVPKAERRIQDLKDELKELINNQ